MNLLEQKTALKKLADIINGMLEFTRKKLEKIIEAIGKMLTGFNETKELKKADHARKPYNDRLIKAAVADNRLKAAAHGVGLCMRLPQR